MSEHAWTTRHISQSIRGALWNRALSHFTHEDGKPMTELEAFDELLKLYREGYERIPMGECDNFDPVKGCLGHRSEQLIETQPETTNAHE